MAKKNKILAVFFGVSMLSMFDTSVAMSELVASSIDLHTLAGHAIVPRPKIIPVCADLGHEDLLLQDILRKAVSVAIENEIASRRVLDVNQLLHQGGGGVWNNVAVGQFAAVLNRLREIETSHNMIYNLRSYRGWVNALAFRRRL